MITWYLSPACTRIPNFTLANVRRFYSSSGDVPKRKRLNVIFQVCNIFRNVSES